MTDKQVTKITLLQDKLRLERNIRKALPVSEHKGVAFTEVAGVTVTIRGNGGIDIPAVRTTGSIRWKQRP